MASSKWRFGIAGLFLVAGGIGLTAAGCVEAEGRFYIQRICTPDPTGTDFTCDPSLYVPEVYGQFGCVGSECVGEIYAGYGSGVRTYVVNGMTPSRSFEGNNNRVETSIILLTDYDVSVSDSSGVVMEWNSPCNGSIPPTIDATGDELSEAGFVVLTNDLMQSLDASASSGQELSLIVGLKLYGRTTGGLEVETPMTYFPLYLTKN